MSGRIRMMIGAGTLIVVVMLVTGIAFLYWHQIDQASIALSRCKDVAKGYRDSCFSDRVSETLTRDGLTKALILVNSLAMRDAAFGQNCHSNMHELGKQAFPLYEQKKLPVIGTEAAGCNYGFYHGFIEEMLNHQGGLSQAKVFCDAIGTVQTVDNCYHGIGHGSVDGYDLSRRGDAAALVAPGLKLCREITDDPEYRSSCELGSFNSVQLMYEDPEYRLDDHGNPYVLCSGAYDESQKQACFIEMSMLAIDEAVGDYKKALDYTVNVEREYQRIAVKYVSVFAFSRGIDPVEVLSTCTARNPTYKVECMQGVVMGLVAYGKPDNPYERVVSFCRGETGLQREQCVHSLLQLNKTETENERICNVFPEFKTEVGCTG